MKEPSELDYALVRDLMFKLRGVFQDGSSLRFPVMLTREHIKMRNEALERILEYSSKMGDEITQLVLQKHQRD